MTVLTTGSFSYDYIMNFDGRFVDRIMPDKLHILSLSFLVRKMEKQLGGCALNFAYTFKLLGGDPLIITAAGNDWDACKKFLLQHKISRKGIHVYKDESCSSYHVVTDKDDNQIGAFYIGASKYNSRLSIRVSEVPGMVLIGPNDPHAMTKYVDECQKYGYPYMYDPAFQIANFTVDELARGISKAEILIGNDYEIALIENRLSISHEELLVMGPNVIVTTLGSKGSIIETKYHSIHIKPAKAKKIIDPTGAGDAYRAGFAAGYRQIVRSKPRPERTALADQLVICGQMGSVAAVYTVEKYGTVTHTFTKSDFIRRYKENYSEEVKI